MILVLENEVRPEIRYFVPEITRALSESRVYDFADEGGRPDVADVDGVVVAGSTAGVYEADEYPWMAEQRAFVRELVDEEVPTYGICFGHQLINEALGGTVEHVGLRAELVEVELADDPLFEGVEEVIPVIHGDVVTERGDGMAVVGSADYYENFATRHRDAPVWTTQYHPEFTARLADRVEADFEWQENEHSFDEVTAVRSLANFERLATSGAY